MLEAVRNAFRLPDLRQKLLITIGILVLYRFAAHIPLPGVDRTALDSLFRGDETNMLLSLLNFFSGKKCRHFLDFLRGRDLISFGHPRSDASRTSKLEPRNGACDSHTRTHARNLPCTARRTACATSCTP